MIATMLPTTANANQRCVFMRFLEMCVLKNEMSYKSN
jgi:hypothetical protein